MSISLFASVRDISFVSSVLDIVPVPIKDALARDVARR